MGYYRSTPNRDRDRNADRDRHYGETDNGGYASRDYGRARYGNDYGRAWDDRERYDRARRGRPSAGYRSPPPGYEADDRDFFDRAGDEIRSWFGDEEAERRRDYDDYIDRPYGDPRDASSRRGMARPIGNRGFSEFRDQKDGFAPSTRRLEDEYHPYENDADYRAWRRDQMDSLDRDYQEYRSENRGRFNQEFGDWRSRRGTQRSLLSQVVEHAEIVGSDGEHVGKVDKVVGDRIILAKNDTESGGIHHSIPSRWIDRVEDGKVHLEKSAEQAKQEWQDAERNRPLGREYDRNDADGPHYLNRSFSGTY